MLTARVLIIFSLSILNHLNSAIMITQFICEASDGVRSMPNDTIKLFKEILDGESVYSTNPFATSVSTNICLSRVHFCILMTWLVFASGLIQANRKES